MGFESSQVARRRLAAAAMRDRRVQEALLVDGAPSLSPAPLMVTSGEPAVVEPFLDATAWGPNGVSTGDGPSLALILDDLAVDILETPGAGGALIEAFAEQSRVLQLVVEALERAPGQPLPGPVAAAVRRVVTGATRAVTTN